MSLFPKTLKEYAVSMGLPRGPKSQYFLVDPVNGSDSNSGTCFESPLLKLETAEALTTANQHDCVFFLAGATADNPTATIAWDKSYTHLVGIGSEMPGLGQRCRVVNAAATVMHGPVITFSGNGCIVKNMQFGNEHGAGTATGVVLVTGERNSFDNVFAMVPFATDAGSYSLKITDGGENVFRNCTIGQQTCVRTAATYNLWIALGAGEANPTRNKFIKCEFLSWSSVTTHVHVLIDADITAEAFSLHFEDCRFLNFPGSGEAGGLLAESINDNMVKYHQVPFWGKNSFGGVTTAGTTLTYMLVQHFSHGGLMEAMAENAET
jgi:hypothetical protein